MEWTPGGRPDGHCSCRGSRLQASEATCSQQRRGASAVRIVGVTRIRSLALLSFSLCLAVGAGAQSLDVVYDGAYRGTALDASLDGSLLWVATSWGVTIHETASQVPQPVATRPLAGTTAAVEAGSVRVYVGSGRTIHVFAKGAAGTILGAENAEGTINDLLLAEPYLLAATSAGVEVFDLFDPDKPVANRTLLTSTGFAHRVAILGATLYAADGDASVEVYNLQIPSFPQPIGSFGSLPRTQSVSEAGGRIYVSDGRRTDVWSGSGASMSLAGTIAAGGTSVVASGDRFVFMAGDDRRLRAFDVSSAANPVGVFASEPTPVGGQVNRLLKIVSNGARLHVAGGDAGLLSWDTTGFGEPFLVRAHPVVTGGSLAAFQGGVAASLPGAGLTRFAVSEAGELSSQVSWDLASTSVVRDVSGATLLVSSGARLRRFDLAANPPAETGSVTLTSAVQSAALQNGRGVAVLTDGSAWVADFSAGNATRVELGGAAPLFVASDGTDVAFAGFGETGTTTILFFRGGDFATSPATADVEGAASSGISLSGGRVACFTFRGISIADFNAAPRVDVVPGSNAAIAVDLELSGENVFLLTSSRMQVWDAGTSMLVGEIGLEGTPVALDHRTGEASVVIATGEGLVTVQYASGTQPPAATGSAGADNRYFRRVLAGERALHVWDGRDLVTAPLASTGLPGPGRVLRPAEAALDVAAVGQRAFFVTPGGAVSGYDPGGTLVSAYQVEEGPDQRILSMRSVAGALWVSIEVGCLSGGCEFRTLVLDPRDGISKTTTLSGGAVAATVEGSRAWAIFDVPDEVRALDVTDPFHPVVKDTVAAEGNPVAIARDTQRSATYVLGNLLYVYDDGLNLVGTVLAPYESDPSGRVSYIDQNVHVAGGTAIVTGRSFSPEVYTIGAPTAWFPAATPGSRAAAVRSSLLREGRVYLLSDYSLEIWSTVGSEQPRRRPVR